MPRGFAVIVRYQAVPRNHRFGDEIPVSFEVLGDDGSQTGIEGGFFDVVGPRRIPLTHQEIAHAPCIVGDIAGLVIKPGSLRAGFLRGMQPLASM